MMPRPVTIVSAPSHLGLRPLRAGHEPGAWRAPAVLLEHGLAGAVDSEASIALSKPDYSSERIEGTGLLNGDELRRFNLRLADAVERIVEEGSFPLVLGGDCSVMLGALAGVRRQGRCGLVHIDGHSDFRHPGNYDAEAILGAAAGMDLAMAVGRGEDIVCKWPDVDGALVRERDVVQIGEREARDEDFAWPDVADTDITRIEIFDARRQGVGEVVRRTLPVVERVGRFWLHCDIDALDESAMPAVDSPGSPGFEPGELSTMLRQFLLRPACIGMTLTIYDPDLDTDGCCANLIVGIMKNAFGGTRSVH